MHARHRIALMCGLLLAGCTLTPKGYVEQGDRLFEQGKYEEAILNYKKALQRDGKFGQAAYRLGMAHLAQNQPREAMDALSQAVDLSPELEEARVALADLALTAYLQSRQRPQFLYDRLTKLAELFRKREPNSFHASRIEGFLRMTDGRMEESVRAFEQALAAKPGDPDATLGLTKPLIELGRFADVERVALASLGLHPAFSPLYDVLYVQYLTQGRRADAEQLLRRKVRDNPGKTEFAVQLCRHYANLKQYPELSAEIQRILRDAQQYPDGRLRLGEFYAAQGNWKEATGLLLEGIQQDQPRKADYRRLLMNALLAQGKPGEALDVAEAGLKDDPKNEAALAVRGTLKLGGGTPADLAAARKDFETLVGLRPQDPVHRFQLGRILHLQGDLNGAQAHYVESAKMRRTYLPPRMALAEMRFDQRQYDESLRLLDGVLAVDGRNPRVRVMHAATQMGLGQMDRAKAELQQLLTEFPGYPAAEIQLAFVLVQEKKYADAERIFEKHREGPERLRSLQGLVAAKEQQNQGEAALALLRAELAKSPEAQPVRELTVATAARLGKYDVALEAYQPLVDRQPASAEVQARLGDLHRMKGDLPAALACFEKAASLDPRNVGVRSMLGYLYGAENRFPEAKKHLEQALALNPNDAGILNNLANVLAESDADRDEALKYAQRALERSPKDPQVRDTLGWVYARAGNLDASRQILENLTREHPQNPTYRYHFGYVLLKKGDRAAARQQFDIALANQPSPWELNRIRELLAQASP